MTNDSKLSGDTNTIMCPQCEGTGKIWLKYVEPYASESSVDETEERWLPCSKCHGSGEIPRPPRPGTLSRILHFIYEFLTWGDSDKPKKPINNLSVSSDKPKEPINNLSVSNERQRYIAWLVIT